MWRFASDEVVNVFFVIWAIRVGVWRFASDEVANVLFLSGRSGLACGGLLRTIP